MRVGQQQVFKVEATDHKPILKTIAIEVAPPGLIEVQPTSFDSFTVKAVRPGKVALTVSATRYNPAHFTVDVDE